MGNLSRITHRLLQKNGGRSDLSGFHKELVAFVSSSLFTQSKLIQSVTKLKARLKSISDAISDHSKSIEKALAHFNIPPTNSHTAATQPSSDYPAFGPAAQSSISRNKAGENKTAKTGFVQNAINHFVSQFDINQSSKFGDTITRVLRNRRENGYNTRNSIFNSNTNIASPNYANLGQTTAIQSIVKTTVHQMLAESQNSSKPRTEFSDNQLLSTSFNSRNIRNSRSIVAKNSQQNFTIQRLLSKIVIFQNELASEFHQLKNTIKRLTKKHFNTGDWKRVSATGIFSNPKKDAGEEGANLEPGTGNYHGIAGFLLGLLGTFFKNITKFVGKLILDKLIKPGLKTLGRGLVGLGKNALAGAKQLYRRAAPRVASFISRRLLPTAANFVTRTAVTPAVARVGIIGVLAGAFGYSVYKVGRYLKLSEKLDGSISKASGGKYGGLIELLIGIKEGKVGKDLHDWITKKIDDLFSGAVDVLKNKIGDILKKLNPFSSESSSDEKSKVQGSPKTSATAGSSSSSTSGAPGTQSAISNKSPTGTSTSSSGSSFSTSGSTGSPDDSGSNGSSGSSAPKESAGGAPKGIVGNAAKLYGVIRDQWGFKSIGGYANRNVAGTNSKSDHATGHALDVMTAINGDYKSEAAVKRGWQLAKWAQENAEHLGIKYVIYYDKIWSASKAAQGWRDYGHPGVNSGGDTAQHRDHVHLSFNDKEADVSKASSIPSAPGATSSSNKSTGPVKATTHQQGPSSIKADPKARSFSLKSSDSKIPIIPNNPLYQALTPSAETEPTSKPASKSVKPAIPQVSNHSSAQMSKDMSAANVRSPRIGNSSVTNAALNPYMI